MIEFELGLVYLVIDQATKLDISWPNEVFEFWPKYLAQNSYALYFGPFATNNSFWSLRTCL